MSVRVLVVDETATRETLLGLLNTDRDIVATPNDSGRPLVSQIREDRPDLVLLALSGQDSDGFALAKTVMAEAPAPIVIAADFDATDQRLTVQAQRAGVLAVVRRPVDATSAVGLIPLIKAMAQVKVVRRWPDPLDPARPLNSPPPGRPGNGQRFGLVAVAASTGGPAAVQQLLTDLPANLPVPLVLVQHIATGFIQGLAERLNSLCALKVKIAQQGETLAAGVVYIAPDGFHLGIAPHCRALLNPGPPVSGIRPSANFLFKTAAEVMGASVCAVIMTGMGADGVEGLRLVHEAGGRVLAQDEASSVVFGMPGAAIAAGVADEVLSLTSIAPRLRLLLGTA